MANKKTSSKKKTTAKAVKTSDENVVRIKAGAASTKKTESAKTATVVSAEKPKKVKKVRTGGPIRGMGAARGVGGYFKGAWQELRLVRWPNRAATWSLTGAVLAYSAFFVVMVLLLDAGFKYLFELILKK